MSLHPRQTSDACLIVACRNDFCRTTEHEPGRDIDGYCEWTADFTCEGDGPWEPVDGEKMLRCPSCNSWGVIYAY